MAQIKATKIFSRRNDIVAYEWVGLSDGDVADHIELPFRPDKSMQVSGNFGTGGDIRVEGSLDPDAAVWGQLKDPQGNAITFLTGNDKDMETILQNAFWFRPTVAAGTGVSVTVRIFG